MCVQNVTLRTSHVCTHARTLETLRTRLPEQNFPPSDEAGRLRCRLLSETSTQGRDLMASRGINSVPDEQAVWAVNDPLPLQGGGGGGCHYGERKK